MAPTYPHAALYAGVTGTVYLLLKIDRRGIPTYIAAEQVNLGEYTSEGRMRFFRKMLAESAIAAVKQWTFGIPTSGQAVSAPFWTARIPVNYLGYRRSEDTYGQWQSYIPGPHEIPAWAASISVKGSPDTVFAGSVTMVDQALQLITPLNVN